MEIWYQGERSMNQYKDGDLKYESGETYIYLADEQKFYRVIPPEEAFARTKGKIITFHKISLRRKAKDK